MTRAPRCGRAMVPYRDRTGTRPAAPQCGRRAGHLGPCRSSDSVARNYQADIDRQSRYRAAS